jgi:hypothetical protein
MRRLAMKRRKPRTPVVSSLNCITCALPLFAASIAGLLFFSGCATKHATVTIHIFGGRSMQEGENNEMEAPSDVHDLIGDLDISGGSTPSLKSSLKSSDRGGGGGKSTPPATGVAPPEKTNAPPPSSSDDRAVSAEGDQMFLSKPISERDGFWVILTPAKYNQTIADGGGLSVGGQPASFAGYHNANRGHWRLGTPGSGTNVEVILVDASGEKVKAWIVPDGGSRYEVGL